MGKRQGRKLTAEARDLMCGHCGQVVLGREDYAVIHQLGGVALNQDHPALVRVLRRHAADDYADCPHCHAWHSLVLEADLDGGPALWSLVGLRLVRMPEQPRYWEGRQNGAH